MAEGDNAAGGNTGGAAGGDTGGTKPWYEGAPSDLVAHLQTHGWDKKSEKEVALAAAQSHFAAQKIIGVPAEEMVRIPKTPGDAAWEKVYEKLGVPKEYKFENLKFKDGSVVDAETLAWVSGQAKALHLTQNAALELAQSVIKQMDDAEATELAETTAAKQRGVEELKKSWGPNWDANLFVAGRAATALGVTAEQLQAAQDTIGYPKVMEMFRNIAARLGEDKMVQQTGPNGTVTMTREMAANRKAELQRDAAWGERYTAGGKKELDEMMALNTILTGTGAKAA